MNNLDRLRLAGSLVLLGLLIVAGCAAIGPSPVPTAETLRAARMVERDEDFAGLRRGRAILLTECTACHRLFEPAEHSAEEWRDILPEMVARTSIGREGARDLEEYLVRASSFVGNAASGQGRAWR